MNFLDYALHHIGCATRILRGEPGALADMDISADGFWRSFEAIPAALPALAFAWTVEARQLRAAGSLETVGSMVARMALLELAFWIAPLIVIAIVLRPLGMANRFSPLVVARNWFSALVAYVYVLVPLVEVFFNDGLTSGATAWLMLFVMGFVLWMSVRLTRVALNTTPAIAVAFVVVETVITYPLAIWSYEVAGLYPGS